MNKAVEPIFHEPKTVYKSLRTHVFRATSYKDGSSLLLKQSDSLDKDYALNGSCNEWLITRDLDPKYSVISSDFLHYERRPLLIFDDQESAPLASAIPDEGMPLELLYQVAIQLSECLASIHECGVIHRDINPSNIVMSRDSKTVQLIDFEHASRLDEQEQSFVAASQLKGTLAYISPEQTGRINRSVDHRADLYSLGATLYQLATGSPPFTYSEPAQLVYAQIAERPSPLSEKATNIPSAFSNIVAKLLEKNPESRYQSAASLCQDLNSIEAALNEGRDLSHFTPDNTEQNSEFTLADGVFGREEEKKQLTNAFNSIDKHAQTLCIQGPSGIGKSALIRELFGVISEHNSFYLSGKFDQLSKAHAYTAIAVALGHFVSLVKADDQVPWAEVIAKSLGKNGPLLTSIVPRFSDLIGEQGELPLMTAKETKTRRNNLFEKLFIDICHTLHQHGRRLVLMIDDLQWADQASIEILKALTQQKPAGLLLIFSFRDNEIGNNEAANEFCQSVYKNISSSRNIKLSPLDKNKVAQWMKSQFNLSTDDALTLSDQLRLRTQGNPFHIRSLINTIIEDKSVYRQEAKSHVKWDEISSLPMTSAEEFLEERLKDLGESQREFITKVSILGNSFNLSSVEKLLQQKPYEFENTLQSLIKKRLVIKSGNILYFAHDKIQQIANKNLSEPQKLELNWLLGKQLYLALPESNDWSLIGECLHHCNQGAALIDQTALRQQLAKLNLTFAKHLMQQAAYLQAESSLQTAQSLLPEVNSERQYSALAAEICIAHGQVLTNTGRGEEGKKLFDWVLDNANNAAQRVPAHVAKLIYLCSVYQMREARGEIICLLQALGLKPPKKVSRWHHLQVYARTMLTPGAWHPEKISHMPDMQDEQALKTMSALSTCLLAAFMAATDYFPLILCHMLRITLKHGSCRYIARALIGFGAINIAFKNFSLAKRYGDAALTVLERYDNQGAESYVNISYASLISHWHMPLQDGEFYLNKGMKAAINMGDYETANIAVNVIMGQNYLSGLNLETIRQKYATLTEHIAERSQSVNFELNNMGREFNHTLASASSDGIAISGKYFDEERIEIQRKKKGDNMYVSAFLADKAYVRILAGKYEEAFSFASQAMSGPLRKSTGSYYWGMLYYCAAYASLECIHIGHCTKAAKKLYKKSRKKISEFAKQCPDNYSVKNQILLAREFELTKGFHASFTQYHHAVDIAKDIGSSQENGQLRELYGRFLLRNGYEELAPAQIMQSAKAYEVWGALPKLKRLQEEFPFLTDAVEPENQQHSINTAQYANTALDFQSLSRSIELLSSSLHENDLIAGLMHALLLNSGANRTAYMTYNEGQISVRAVQEGQSICQHYFGRDAILANFDFPSNIIEKSFQAEVQEVLLNDSHHADKGSVLILPIERQNRLTGVVYLENSLTNNAFRPDQINILQILAGQAAIALENAGAFKALDIEKSNNEDLIRSAPMMVVAMDFDAIIKYVNPEAEAVTGFSKEELIGKNWWNTLYAGVDETLRRQQALLVVHEGLDKSEYTIKTKSGDDRIVLWTSVIKKTSDSEKIVMLFGLDSTEEIKAKREIVDFNEKLQTKVTERTIELENSLSDLRKTQDKLVESEKNAALAGLVAGIAHEINTPIGIGVTGVTQFLDSTRDIVRDYNSGNMSQKKLELYFKSSASIAELTHNNLRRAADLVTSFKQISVDQASELKRRFQVKEYIEQLLGSLRTQYINRPITIELDKNDDFEINSHPGLFAQIITNLVMNSLIHGFDDNDTGVISIDIKNENNFVKINYRDSGKGISEENIKKIFDPFFTTNNHGGGSGLGLSIINNIVRQSLQGELECYSKINEGVHFYIKIPITT